MFVAAMRHPYDSCDLHRLSSHTQRQYICAFPLQVELPLALWSDPLVVLLCWQGEATQPVAVSHRRSFAELEIELKVAHDA